MIIFSKIKNLSYRNSKYVEKWVYNNPTFTIPQSFQKHRQSPILCILYRSSRIIFASHCSLLNRLQNFKITNKSFLKVSSFVCCYPTAIFLQNRCNLLYPVRRHMSVTQIFYVTDASLLRNGFLEIGATPLSGKKEQFFVKKKTWGEEMRDFQNKIYFFFALLSIPPKIATKFLFK